MTIATTQIQEDTIESSKFIGKIITNCNLPTVVFFGGIHGNEKAGVRALNQLFNTLNKSTIKGNIYGILGNTAAIKNKTRYIDVDLNRQWTPLKIKHIQNTPPELLNTEEKELKEIHALICNIINYHTGPIYFIDFHTTSSNTLPFITINDAIINRKFSKLFPVPTILGIEEYLEGALLSYINQLGYVSLGFEAGQHYKKDSVDNCYLFALVTLLELQILTNKSIKNAAHYKKKLSIAANNNNVLYEITYLYSIKEDEKFTMLNGFKTFQKITKKEKLATSNNKAVLSPKKGTLFMPLYQNKGKEGFFIIRKIPHIFLQLSVWLRNIKYDSILVWLPGVSWHNTSKTALVVNLSIARFMTKPFFHLLGYRSWLKSKNKIIMYNREKKAKTHLYNNTSWFT